jgi:integrase
MASIDRRGKKWRAQVRRQGYKPQSKSFPTKAEAERWARELEGNLDKGVELDAGELRRQTVRDLLVRFREEEAPLRKGSRWEITRINHLLDTADFVRLRLDQQVTDALRTWAKKRLAEVSAATVNRDLNLISGIFRVAIKEWGLPLQSNPAHNIARPKVDSKGAGQVWTDAEFDKLRATAAEMELGAGSAMAYVVPALELSIETAMRLGEVCSIEAENVNIEARWILLDETKNGDSRRVPLSNRAVELLEPLLAARPTGLIFPITKGTLGLRYRQLRKAAGLEGIRFHDARHTAATRASKKLGNVLELAAFTGHRSLQSLKRYYHSDATELAKKLG